MTNSLFPVNYQLAQVQYPQLEFPWAVLYQTINKESNLLLDRRFSFLEFLEFTLVELVNEPLYNDFFKKISDFHFYIERPVENINYFSRYTWTIDNSKDGEGNYNDPEWLFNKYQGWERSKITYLHSGKYLPVEVGYIKWGFPSDIVINPKVNSSNLTNPLDTNLSLKFSINTSIGTITDKQIPTANKNLTEETTSADSVLNTYPVLVKILRNKTSYVIPLGDLTYVVEIKSAIGDVQYFWTDFEGNIEIPFTQQREFVKTTHIKIIIPTTALLTPTPVSTGLSKVGGVQKQVYSSVGYLDIYLYGYKIYQTVNLTNPVIEESTYEVYPADTEVNLTDPWPNYPKLNLDIKNYMT